MVFTDNSHHTADNFQVQPRTFNLDGLTYQTEDLTVNLVPIIVTLFILYFVRIFTLLGGDFDDFMELSMNGITGGMSGYDALDSTYSPPLSGGYDAPSGDYNAPQTSYNAPQTSYNAPQTSYNAPQTSYNAPQSSYNSPQTSYNAPQNSYNAPQTSYNTPQATYGRLDFGIDPKYQVEAFGGNSPAQNDDNVLTDEELALYNQLLLANNYLLEPNDKKR